MGYFATGLTWTVYATSLDDKVGSMDGYTAIVYPGTVDEDQSDDASYSEEQEELPPISDTIGLRVLSFYPRVNVEGYDGVYVSDVRDLYSGKEAEVLTINAQSFLNDPVPQLRYVGNKTVGIFGARSYITKNNVHKIVEMFKRENVDSIICVTKRLAMLSTLEGIDVVILTEDSLEYTETGNRVNDTLVIQAPKKGEAGVVFLSNNNVASARSIDVL